jgi:fructose-1,6-bisphosphatase II
MFGEVSPGRYSVRVSPFAAKHFVGWDRRTDVTGNVVEMTQTRVLGSGYDSELVASLREATEAAATASREWMGRGDKNGADQAAVSAMREVLARAPFAGTVVIGEGEKDAAPMLANGERLGQLEPGSGGREYDVAVDPLDGTRLVAAGIPGSLCVIALAPRGTMFDPADVFYMDKLICGPAGRGVVDIRKPVGENLRALAAAEGREVSDLVAVILDKPRHERLIAEVVQAGATLRLVGEGDVAAAADAASGGSVVVGIGGTPEGIIAACAVRALGGFMQGRLAPQSVDEALKATRAGHHLARILELDDLVRSDEVLFVSTAV